MGVGRVGYLLAKQITFEEERTDLYKRFVQSLVRSNLSRTDLNI